MVTKEMEKYVQCYTTLQQQPITYTTGNLRAANKQEMKKTTAMRIGMNMTVELLKIPS